MTLSESCAFRTSSLCEEGSTREDRAPCREEQAVRVLQREQQGKLQLHSGKIESKVKKAVGLCVSYVFV